MDKLEVIRQLIHMSGVLIPLAVILLKLDLNLVIIALVLFIIVYVSSEYLRVYKKIKIPIISDVVENAIRQEEKMALTSAYYLGAMVLLFLLVRFNICSIEVAGASIAVLGLGDGVSTLIGKHFGKTRNPINQKKSIEGSISGIIAASLGAAVFIAFPLAITGALIGMFVEMLPINLNDNFTVPISAAAGMQFALIVGI